MRVLISLIFASTLVFMHCSAQCPPRPPTKPDFDPTQYIGMWYANREYDYFTTHPGSKCATANYKAREDGDIDVYNTEIEINDDGSERYDEVCGLASQVDAEAEPGLLRVTFYVEGVPEQIVLESDYLVMDTDYENFSAVYNCGPYLNGTIEVGWVLTREPNPPQEVIDRAVDAFIRNGLPVDTLIPVPQGDAAGCTYEVPEDSCSLLQ